MSNVIQDGKGRGFRAEVDDHGRLFTRANVIGHMSHHATYHKNAYIGLFETTLADTSQAACAFLQNTDAGKDIEIYWMRVSANADVEVDIISDNDYGSLGAAASVYNTNLATPNALSANLYEGGASGDLVLVTTHNFPLDGYFSAANSPLSMNYDGGLVLGHTRSIAVKVTGAANDKVKVMMGFALHAKDTQL